MKLTKDTILPYPVFGIEGDYNCPIPNCYYKISSESNDAYHIIECTIDGVEENKVKELLSLIDNEDAVLSYEVDCSYTLTRFCKKIDKENVRGIINGKQSLVITLDKKQFAQRVSISPFITAVKPIELSGKHFNNVYDVKTFMVEPGDVLATFMPFTIDVSLDWKHLYRNAGAPIRIEKSEQKNAVIETILADEIIVKLPPKEYKEFKENLENNSMAAPIILMSLARPAIMTALTALSKDPMNGSSWAEALRCRIDSDDLLEDFRPDKGDWSDTDFSNWEGNIEKIASLIFKGVESNMFKQLQSMVNSQD